MPTTAKQIADSRRTLLDGLRNRCHALARREGRRPRILVAAPGDRAPIRATEPIAVVLAEVGWDVDVCPPTQIPKHIAHMAIENDVHAVWMLLTADHQKDLPAVFLDHLNVFGSTDVVLIVTGEAQPEVSDQDAVLVFPTHTPIIDAAEQLTQRMEQGT